MGKRLSKHLKSWEGGELKGLDGHETRVGKIKPASTEERRDAGRSEIWFMSDALFVVR